MFKWIKKHFIKKKEVVTKPACDIERLRKLAGINNSESTDHLHTTEFIYSDDEFAKARELAAALKQVPDTEVEKVRAELQERWDNSFKSSVKLSVGVRNKDGSSDTMIIKNDGDLMDAISCSLKPPVDRIDHWGNYLKATETKRKSGVDRAYE